MQTSSKEYYSELFRIQDENAASIAVLLPSTENIYDIDLASRTIAKPDEYTIVETDNRSETIFFRVPRYYDNIDLAQTVCIVQYINANKESYIYAVPYYDVDTYSTCDPDEGIDEPMMLIPWRIGGTAAAKAGVLTFAFRFYKLDSSGTHFEYNLNTLSQNMKINEGLKVNTDEIENEETEEYLAAAYADFLSNMQKAANEGSLRWIVL